MNTGDCIREITLRNQFLTRQEHALCRSLIDTMSTDELEELERKGELDWHLLHYVEERLSPKLDESVKKLEHNKDWHIYFKELRERASGRVCIARKRIHDIFPFLKWADQLQVLQYSLHGSKSDRIWSLKQMYDNWVLIEDCKKDAYSEWIKDIESVWKKWKDEECAFLVLRYLPVEVVVRNEIELTSAVGYKWVALSLGRDSDYVVVREKLSDVDYLYVMSKLGKTMKRKEAEAIFMKILKDVSIRSDCPIVNIDTSLSLLSDRYIGLAIWSLGKLNQSDIIIDFYHFYKALQASLANRLPIETYKQQQDYWDAICDRMAECFSGIKPDKEVLDDMMKENYSLKELVSYLNLELYEE